MSAGKRIERMNRLRDLEVRERGVVTIMKFSCIGISLVVAGVLPWGVRSLLAALAVFCVTWLIGCGLVRRWGERRLAELDAECPWVGSPPPSSEESK